MRSVEKDQTWHKLQYHLLQVMNIQELNVKGTKFNETHDHSKWAVATDLDVYQHGGLYVCIGDINRVVRKSVGQTLQIELD